MIGEVLVPSVRQGRIANCALCYYGRWIMGKMDCVNPEVLIEAQAASDRGQYFNRQILEKVTGANDNCTKFVKEE